MDKDVVMGEERKSRVRGGTVGGQRGGVRWGWRGGGGWGFCGVVGVGSCRQAQTQRSTIRKIEGRKNLENEHSLLALRRDSIRGRGEYAKAMFAARPTRVKKKK